MKWRRCHIQWESKRERERYDLYWRELSRQARLIEVAKFSQVALRRLYSLVCWLYYGCVLRNVQLVYTTVYICFNVLVVSAGRHAMDMAVTAGTTAVSLISVNTSKCPLLEASFAPQRSR